MNQLGVSIIICCHNGALRLSETVRHIAQQRVGSGIPWEFILVDNGCTDNSIAVAEAVWTAYGPRAEFRVAREPVLGLSHARARGFREAQYEFMVLCDDDNWLAPDYVTTTFRIMSENASIGALGGFGKLYFEIDPPKWIEHSKIFAAGEQAPRPGKVARNRIYGAGCVVRKSAHQKLTEAGFKSFLHDRRGSALTSGGDYELCYALVILGYDIWYDDRLRFVHFITRERLTWEYFIKYARESCSCFDVLTSYKMIAADMSAHKFPFIVMGRDFFYCVRRFIRIGLKRLAARPGSSSARLHYFRYIIFRDKLMTYFLKYRDIIRHHEEIIRFKENCTTLRQAKSVKTKFQDTALGPISSLKPSRLLP